MLRLLDLFGALRLRRYMFDNKSIGVTLWDTAGQERFKTITSTFYRGTHGAVFGALSPLGFEARIFGVQVQC